MGKGTDSDATTAARAAVADAYRSNANELALRVIELASEAAAGASTAAADLTAKPHDQPTDC